MGSKVFNDVKKKEQKKSYTKKLITLEVKAQLVVKGFQKHDILINWVNQIGLAHHPINPAL